MNEETKTIEKYSEIISKEILDRNFISQAELKIMINTNVLMCINEISKKRVTELAKNLAQTKLILKTINELGGEQRLERDKSSIIRLNLKQNVGLFNCTREELKRIGLKNWLKEKNPELLNEFFQEFDSNVNFHNPEYNKNDLKLRR